MADPMRAAAERERNKTRSRQERAANPERQRQRVREHRQRHPELCKARGRDTKAKAYQRDPEKFKARTAAQRALRFGDGGKITGTDLRAAFARQSGCCHYCGEKVGRTAGPWHADHFIPISRGGANVAENIVIACEPCNRQKYNKMPWEFMPERFSPPTP
ncbi:HNH endonuclease [Deinococcus gobiensis]|nr:HNH endonuclease signature motif containing protein [Deinococcus gobiensis]